MTQNSALRFSTMKWWKNLCFLAFCTCIKLSIQDCVINRHELSIELKNTSVNNYFYEILKTTHSYDFFLILRNDEHLVNISISDSSFPHIQKLQNPSKFEKYRDAVKITILEIKNSSIQTIEPYAFQNFKSLKTLDLSNNQIKEISFTYILNSANFIVLKYNEINVDVLDLNYYDPSSTIDLSFNNIKNVSVMCTMVDYNYYKSISINLAYNLLEDINFNKYSCMISLNLEGNKNFSKKQNTQNFVRDINMAYAINNVTKPLEIYGINIFNISNNKIVHLNKNLISNIRSYAILDVTNCSLIDIEPNVFYRGMELSALVLTQNNFENFDKAIFDLAKISYLEISYSNVKHVENIFKSLTCIDLVLKSNSISKLSLKSFDEIRYVENLDLSFNKLWYIQNKSFVNCIGLKTLNISNNGLQHIEILAFYSLERLEKLDLSFNNIMELEPGVFNTLKSITSLNLEKSLLMHSAIRNGVFKNLPLQSLNLKENTFYYLEKSTFSNLKRLTKLERVSVKKISSNAFESLSSLESFDLDKVTALNFSESLAQNNLKNLTLTLQGNVNLKSHSFLDLINLESLEIQNSSIGNIENATFLGLFSLERLHFLSTNITNYEKNSLKGLYNLIHLDVKVFYKDVKTIKANFFDDLNSITNLDFSNLSLTKIENFAFVGLKSLEYLTLNNNSFNILTDKSFSGLYKLKTLNLSFSNIEDIENYTFYDLDNLKELDLQGNDLKNLSDSKFKMKSLVYLNVENCKISKLSKNVFEYLEKLERLNLKNNLIDQIEDLQIDSFAHISNLLELNLAENFIEVFKVGIFSNLGKLRILDLSNNNITKFVIEAFIPLKSLESLSLDKNYLKTLNILQYLPFAANLTRIGIAQNKLPCDKLGMLIKEFRNKTITYKPSNPNFEVDNIEGIECVDACKFLFCLKDTHGIN